MDRNTLVLVACRHADLGWSSTVPRVGFENHAFFLIDTTSYRTSVYSDMLWLCLLRVKIRGKLQFCPQQTILLGRLPQRCPVQARSIIFAPARSARRGARPKQTVERLSQIQQTAAIYCSKSRGYTAFLTLVALRA